jgi:hypothetical protein
MRGAKFTTISYLFAGLEARAEARCAVKGASIFVARYDRVAAADAAAAWNGSDENDHSEPNSFETPLRAFMLHEVPGQLWRWCGIEPNALFVST